MDKKQSIISLPIKVDNSMACTCGNCNLRIMENENHKIWISCFECGFERPKVNNIHEAINDLKMYKKLHKCPYCKSSDVYNNKIKSLGFQIICINCGLRGPIKGEKSWAWEAWQEINIITT